uniref:HTH OST-type domain-containing protein n=1 Tax=Panagrellus redivivus TaxID=6233 RepID=A0A7E4VZ83_PANRE
MVEVKHDYYVNTLCSVLKGICNVDPVMRGFALAKLQDTVKRFTRKPPTVDSVNEFLGSVKDGDLHWLNREGSVVCSAETRYRMAIDHCATRGITIKAVFDQSWTLNVTVSAPAIGGDRNFDASTIKGLYSHLRWLSSETHLHRLVFELQSQGFRRTLLLAESFSLRASSKASTPPVRCNTNGKRVETPAKLQKMPQCAGNPGTCHGHMQQKQWPHQSETQPSARFGQKDRWQAKRSEGKPPNRADDQNRQRQFQT